MALAALLCAIRPAHGVPADIFSIAAPVVGSDPSKETALQDGDASVSTQTGAFQYNYPIQVPPGRQGMQPPRAVVLIARTYLRRLGRRLVAVYPYHYPGHIEGHAEVEGRGIELPELDGRRKTVDCSH